MSNTRSLDDWKAINGALKHVADMLGCMTYIEYREEFGLSSSWITPTWGCRTQAGSMRVKGLVAILRDSIRVVGACDLR